MNTTSNPFIEKYSTLVESVKTSMKEYHPAYNYYAGLHPNLRSTIEASLIIFTIIGFIYVNSCVVKHIESTEVSIVSYLFSSVLAIYCSCSSIERFLLMLKERERRLYHALDKRLEPSDYHWIAATLRDFQKRPEYTPYLETSNLGHAKIKEFLRAELQEKAKMALSKSEDTRVDLLAYLFSPITEDQKAIVVKGDYLHYSSFDVDLLSSISFIDQHEERVRSEELTKKEKQRIETELSVLPAVE